MLISSRTSSSTRAVSALPPGAKQGANPLSGPSLVDQQNNSADRQNNFRRSRSRTQPVSPLIEACAMTEMPRQLIDRRRAESRLHAGVVARSLVWARAISRFGELGTGAQRMHSVASPMRVRSTDHDEARTGLLSGIWVCRSALDRRCCDRGPVRCDSDGYLARAGGAGRNFACVRRWRHHSVSGFVSSPCQLAFGWPYRPTREPARPGRQALPGFTGRGEGPGRNTRLAAADLARPRATGRGQRTLGVPSLSQPRPSACGSRRAGVRRSKPKGERRNPGECIQ
jgi:hypothetical protein